MITDFYIISGETVPTNYSWDQGSPNKAAGVPLYNVTPFISGYAPKVRVVFKNDSTEEFTLDTGIVSIFTWNFGDYYNSLTNVFPITGTDTVSEHTYIMPGLYTVTLTQTQTTLGENTDTANDKLCKGKYNIRWFWDDLNSDDLNAITWDNTKLTGIKPKTWGNELGCFEKHCTFWSWKDLAEASSNPVKWNETIYESSYPKKWVYEPNETVCSTKEGDITETTDTQGQSTIKTYIVRVVELPPTAGIHCVTSLTGMTPLTVRLSPKTCIPGSFPIDRIDWDFNDGSPIKTITRFTVVSADKDIVTSNPLSFPDDIQDVRNFDVLHTYERNINTTSVYFPTLTCYSASTNTSDSCSLMVGPIILPIHPEQTTLIKSRSINNQNIYVASINNNITFLTTSPQATAILNNKPIQNIPPAVIRNTYGIRSTIFRGNSGGDVFF
jgi:hypothetical protein